MLIVTEIFLHKCIPKKKKQYIDRFILESRGPHQGGLVVVTFVLQDFEWLRDGFSAERLCDCWNVSKCKIGPQL